MTSRPSRSASWDSRRVPATALLALICGLAPASLQAYENGRAVGHTGGFGEPSCNASGCHRAAPIAINRQAFVRLEVGPYVPGISQQVKVILEGRGANSWGFSTSPRLASDTSRPAGTMARGVSNFVDVRCADGSFARTPLQANCGAQYATQSAVGAIGSGQAGFKEFFFDWTPPSSDVGEIIFAISAVAADGDKGTNNDVTATTQQRSIYAPSNRPAISTGGVVSAAALQRSNQTVAPKQLLTIFGSNLNVPGAFIPVSEVDFDFQDLAPTELARVSVVFTYAGNANETPGRMLFVGDRQVNVQAPDFPSSAKSVFVQVVINRDRGMNEIRSNIVEMPAAQIAPGLFTLDSSGVGPAAAVNGVSGQIIAPPGFAVNGVPVNGVQARAGDVVLLYGTGFGKTDPDFRTGERAKGQAQLRTRPTIEIGGLIADSFYSGAAPTFIGLQQFNIRVPNLPPGVHPITMRSSTAITQTGVTLSVR